MSCKQARGSQTHAIILKLTTKNCIEKNMEIYAGVHLCHWILLSAVACPCHVRVLGGRACVRARAHLRYYSAQRFRADFAAAKRVRFAHTSGAHQIRV